MSPRPHWCLGNSLMDCQGHDESLYIFSFLRSAAALEHIEKLRSPTSNLFYHCSPTSRNWSKRSLPSVILFIQKKALLSHWLSPGRQLQSLTDATLRSALQILTFILRFLASLLTFAYDKHQLPTTRVAFLSFTSTYIPRGGGHESATAELSGRFTYRSNHQMCATL